MIALVDAGLFLLLLSGALFLGSVGLILFKEISKKENTDESQKPQ